MLRPDCRVCICIQPLHRAPPLRPCSFFFPSISQVYRLRGVLRSRRSQLARRTGALNAGFPALLLEELQERARQPARPVRGLLSEEESKFIGGFFALPQDCQCLLTRMLMRKGPRFRRATLQYPEVRDTAGALQTLAAGQWIDLNPIVDLEQLSRTLEPQEWRESFGSAVRRIQLQDSQLTFPCRPARRRHAQWPNRHQRLAHRYVEVRVAATAEATAMAQHRRMTWQTWAEFVLADLGALRHERVGHDAASCAFQSRDEVEHFHRLNDCRERLRDGGAAAEVFQAAAVPASVTERLAAEFGQLHVRIGQILQRRATTSARWRPIGLQAFRRVASG